MIARALVLGLALALPVAAGAEVLPEPDPTVLFDANDPEMNSAITAARKSLPLFLNNALDADGFGPRGAYVKVRFPVSGGNFDNENIWVGPFLRLDRADFVGLLANQPEAMPGLNAGDQVTFDYDMIVDWNLDAGAGRFYGDYTTRVVISRLSQSEQNHYKARFIDPPVPTDWLR
ncbi:Uncharacterized conserved protein YegJ, DUF2314 family [Cognatiyoonia koreensis]|uniref:Uncharacterized conserved protein YegJ, DUF2314 family n=1 Tax=Cognatiyoonia koreensis TaxID=364200 RepID=A0A1I0Q484_9RHOB|nr:DUF2314 domain-containing protein [Cognatiyoonia koreensis]SEW21702.1 Uncharacterized conserved protein YegJ, DUF2314 family [Cognatiyoonia koreensis]